MKSLCEDVQAWLLNQDELHITPPPDDLSDHVASCEHCRGSLLLLISELLSVPRDIESISCNQCQQRLAPYIDKEFDHGLSSAALAFPEVWLHLWTCAECAETYRVMVSVLNQTSPTPVHVDIPQSQPAPVPVDIPKPQRAAVLLFEMPRVFLNRILQMPLSLGITWGPEEGDLVVLDKTSYGYDMQLSVRRQPDGDWTIIVQIEPPVMGQAVLTFDAERLYGQFDSGGQARFTSVRDAFISATDGPSLSLAVALSPD